MSEPLKTCAAKHTKYQPTDDEWKCPKCGAGADDTRGEFIIQEPDTSADHDCSALHDLDELGCNACEHGVSGKAFAARIQKRRNLVPCVHCKGKGLVPGGVP